MSSIINNNKNHNIEELICKSKVDQDIHIINKNNNNYNANHVLLSP